jgi:hypothetical protein
MTDLLQKAISEAKKRSSKEQDALAQLILDEIASEQRWEDKFANSGDELSKLADEALAEHIAGRTHKLDPDTL